MRAAPRPHGAESALDRVERAVDDATQRGDLDDVIADALEEGLADISSEAGAATGQPADLADRIDDEIAGLLADVERLDMAGAAASPPIDAAHAPSEPLVAADDPELQSLGSALDNLAPATSAARMTSPGDKARGNRPSPPGHTTRASQVAAADVNPAVLSELDETLADDVAHLFQSDASAVESVLDSIFDEQAIFVRDEPPGERIDDRVGVGPGASGRAIAQAAIAGEAPRVGGSHTMMDPADDLAGDLEAAQTVVMLDVEREMAGGLNRRPAPQPARAPTAGAIDFDGGSAVSTPSAAASKGPSHRETTAESAKPGPTKPSAAAPAMASPTSTSTSSQRGMPVQADTNESARSPRRTATVPAVAQAEDGGSAAFDLAMTALMVINWPMRFVPRGLRTYVDLFALSLLVWAPIVWVVVWMLRQ